MLPVCWLPAAAVRLLHPALLLPLLLPVPAASADESLALSDGPVYHEHQLVAATAVTRLYQSAIKELSRLSTPNITVEPTFSRMVRLGSRSMAAAFIAGNVAGCVPGELELAVQLLCRRQQVRDLNSCFQVPGSDPVG
ncbi:MAG: hypothetical protein ACLVJH_03775 [Faecalibacterium prausnitzii]